jgi:carbon storage regulator
MLVLTRRVGEVIRIGEQVTVAVLGIKGNQVRLGVGAPSDVSVHREEVFRRIQQEVALRESKQEDITDT